MKKNIKKYIVILFSSIAMLSLDSCVEDTLVSETEPKRYTNADIKSYADLFSVFWKVMDENYNYFYEQTRKDGKNWNDIYKEYYPKFAELKTYRNNDKYNDLEFIQENAKVKQYFSEIVSPILDKHFALQILIHKNSKDYEQVTFRSKSYIEDVNGVYALYKEKYNYMPKLLNDGYLQYKFPISYTDVFNHLTGTIKGSEDIHYLGFSNFYNYGLAISLRNKGNYFDFKKNIEYAVTLETLENNKYFKKLTKESFKNFMRSELKRMLDVFENFVEVNKDDINKLNQYAKDYRENEVITEDFINLCTSLLDKYNIEIEKLSISGEIADNFGDEEIAFVQFHFFELINNHINHYVEGGVFVNDVNTVIENGIFYIKFLNALRDGKIKKIIIDLRGNGGGAVRDARFMIDRFITKENVIFGYQRTKEGTGKTNYSPWIPIHTQRHKDAIPKEIPIVILTDKYSASMSEYTTLALKSQGSQVISIGDYTAGATAGLTSNRDTFNGGLVGIVANVMYLYMPVMAFKNSAGEVIEGIGVKPDIYVPSLTVKEVENIINNSSPSLKDDKVLYTAVEYLKTK